MRPRIKQPDPPIPAEILAEHIQKLSEIGKQLANSRLKQKTIIILLASMTRVSQASIKAILDALPELEREFLR
jgi:siroheme synthase